LPDPGHVTLVVLLRAINLGATNKVQMAHLRGLLADLDARDVVTHLQSGQAVVDAPASAVAGFADRVHDAIEASLGLSIDVMIRTPAELAAVVDGNPFPHLVASPKRLHAVFLDTTPDAAAVAAVGTRHGEDEFVVGDRVLYAAFAGSTHDSPLQVPMRRLGGRQTARNWATVTALHDLCTKR